MNFFRNITHPFYGVGEYIAASSKAVDMQTEADRIRNEIENDMLSQTAKTHKLEQKLKRKAMRSSSVIPMSVPVEPVVEPSVEPVDVDDTTISEAERAQAEFDKGCYQGGDVTENWEY